MRRLIRGTTAGGSLAKSLEAVVRRLDLSQKQAAEAYALAEQHEPNPRPVYRAVVDLVELVHDPLGLELLLNGTIRNEVVRFEDDGREVGGIRSLRDRLAVHQRVFPGRNGDRNTLRIGVIVLSAQR